MKRKLYRSSIAILFTLSALCLFSISLFQRQLLFSSVTYWQDRESYNDHVLQFTQGLKARKLLEDDVITAMEALTFNFTHRSTQSDDFKQRLPQCIIIGARKCGTRALLNFLSLHSKIVTPGDEMHFFSNDSNYNMGLEWYRAQMPFSTPDQITIEKTPKYFISLSAPSRVHSMNNSIKLIVILRDPTTRVISDFTQIYANKHLKNNSEEYFESIAINPHTDIVNLDYKALQISIYHQHLARWLQVFPRTQILVLDGEALIKDPLSQISKAETFLGLPHEVKQSELYFNKSRGFFCMRKRHMMGTQQKCMGVNKGRKHVDISAKAMQKLHRFFKPHNEILFKLIGRRIRWR